MRRNAHVFHFTILAAALSLATTADAGWWDPRGLRNDYGVAILSPVDTGLPQDRPLWGRRRHDCVYVPYYSPLTPLSVRWRTCNHRSDIYTHYYPGYWACGYRGPNLFVSGGDPIAGPAWACPTGGAGCAATSACGFASGDYGTYTGAPRDEASLLRLGGSGSGTPGVHHGTPDIIDMIQGCRRP